MYRVIATVRKLGAIGVEYQREFLIEGTFEIYADVKDKWFDLYENEWELLHFDVVQKVAE